MKFPEIHEKDSYCQTKQFTKDCIITLINTDIPNAILIFSLISYFLIFAILFDLLSNSCPMNSSFLGYTALYYVLNYTVLKCNPVIMIYMLKVNQQMSKLIIY